jgi:hypothetical protein
VDGVSKTLWAVLIIGVIVALDVGLANLPGPVPTSHAVSAAEGSADLQAVVGNGSYRYDGYSDDPSTSLACVGGGFPLNLDPVHEYTTTTLIFFVHPNLVHTALGNGTSAGLPFLLLVQINPASGAIDNIRTLQTC